MISEQDIQEVTRRLVEGFHPAAIILFGSHARGEPGPDSDLDVIVICDEVTNRNEQEAAMMAALRGIRVPIDVLLYTPSEFAAERERLGTVAYPAWREGKVVYGHAA